MGLLRIVRPDVSIEENLRAETYHRTKRRGIVSSTSSRIQNLPAKDEDVFSFWRSSQNLCCRANFLTLKKAVPSGPEAWRRSHLASEWRGDVCRTCTRGGLVVVKHHRGAERNKACCQHHSAPLCTTPGDWTRAFLSWASIASSVY